VSGTDQERLTAQEKKWRSIMAIGGAVVLALSGGILDDFVYRSIATGDKLTTHGRNSACRGAELAGRLSWLMMRKGQTVTDTD